MLWFLNEYIVNDKLVFKIVKIRNVYENWELIETYILNGDKFCEYQSYIKNIKFPEQSMFKKLLGFFNRL